MLARPNNVQYNANMSSHISYASISADLAAFLGAFFDKSPSSRSNDATDFREVLLTTIEQATRYVDRQDPLRCHWAADSYIHANGFERLVLFATECGRYRVRLHGWPTDFNSERLNVHNHRYSFASLVLQGALEDVQWRRAAEGKYFREFHYKSRDAHGRYEHQYVGETNLAISNRQRFSAGDLYLMPFDRLHYTVPVGTSPTVTLFAEDRRQVQPSATTFSWHLPVKHVDTFLPALPVEIYWQRVRAVLSNCSTAV